MWLQRIENENFQQGIVYTVDQVTAKIRIVESASPFKW